MKHMATVLDIGRRLFLHIALIGVIGAKVISRARRAIRWCCGMRHVRDGKYVVLHAAD